MSDSSASVAFDPFDPAFLADPYPTYARLRDTAPVLSAQAPVIDDPRARTWVLSRYEHVSAAARDWQRFSSSPLNAGVPGMRFLIGSDPPDHTTLRRLVNRPFHPNAVKAMEPRIRELAAGLVDILVEKASTGPADLVELLSEPLPVIVIAEMLGIPADRRADFKRWSDAMIGGLSPDFDRNAGAVAAMEMFGYFNEVVAERKERPGDDLISVLVGGKEPLSNPELLMFCMLLLVAGNETTTNLISNMTAALFENEEAMARLRADPSLLPAAIEEALRFDSPVQSIWRMTTTDVEIEGVEIPERSLVTLLYGAANRDPAAFADPDRFDIDRRPTNHLAFGSGIHLCLGAPLARLEARVAFELLLTRTSLLEPAGAGERIQNLIVRGMRRLPVSCQAA
ncbi:MAG TPA: cytochrome P450 [Acidimicrobiales bacterium]|nr:cytochrome P450 [Acidimicrobiales bacterium]